jgi:hypothetical protein
MVYRMLIHVGTFHDDNGTVLGEEPLAQGEQLTRGGTILAPLQTYLSIVTDMV